MSHDHIVSSFDNDLDQMKIDILRMGGLVEAQIVGAMGALVKRDCARAQRVIDADEAIDNMEQDLSEQAVKIIALRQPVANDLRQVVSALRIVTDLERIGDHATNIAKRVERLKGQDRLPGLGGVRRLNELVQEIVTFVLDAYSNRDVKAALATLRMDETIDEFYTALFREHLTYMMEDPRTIGTSIEFLFIAKNLERMGDHATNIAESVHYLVTGEQLGADLRQPARPAPGDSERRAQALEERTH